VQVVSISCNEVPQCDSYRKVTPMMDIDGWDDTGGAGDLMVRIWLDKI